MARTYFRKRTTTTAAVPDVVNPLENTIGFHLRLASEAYFSRFHQSTGAQELRPGQFSLLAILASNPGINQTTLGQINNRQKSTLTTSVRLLERGGLIRRTRSPTDRRNYVIEITDAGRERLRHYWAYATGTEDAVGELLGTEAKAQLITTLRQIIRGLG